VARSVLISVEDIGLGVMAVVLVVVIVVVVVLVFMLVVVRVVVVGVLVLGLEGLDDVLNAVLGLDLGGLGRESHLCGVGEGVGLFGRVKCCECKRNKNKNVGCTLSIFIPPSRLSVHQRPKGAARFFPNRAWFEFKRRCYA